MSRFIAMAVLAVLLAGCGEESTETADTGDMSVTVSLAIMDSIGIEMGDSCYVLGAVEGVAYGPDGNIAVLDCALSSIRIYSPDGEFIRQIGRRGNGPGEMQSVAFLGISEDGHIFLAGEGSEILGLHRYDYATGEWLGSSQSMGTPPTCIEGAEDSCHVRKDITLDMSTGEPVVVMSVSKYRFGVEEPLATFFETSFPYNPAENYAHLINVVWYGVDLAADFAGNVYLSERSSQEAVVVKFGPDGTETARIELDLEPVLRTADELEMERMILTTKALAMGDGDLPPLEPDPYKPMITGLEIDGEGKLWVQLGGPVTPTFEVFSPDGEHLYTAELAGDHPDGASWRFFIDSHGILAYAEDPAEGFQKVYMLQVVE